MCIRDRPLVGAISALVLAVGAIMYMHEIDGGIVMGIGLIMCLGTMAVWWRDVIKEGEHGGHHTTTVQLGLRYGMVLFIASEVMFFVAWFWAFFDASLYADEAIQIARVEHTGGTWPPQGVEVFNPWHLPLINTIILLTSGTTVTWAHHGLKEGKRNQLILGLIATVLLGFIFVGFQAYEYSHAYNDLNLKMSSGIYGSTFYMLTGFHGFHVTLGAIMLTVILFRCIRGHFSNENHFGFEAVAWYWHFVDVVWLGLFVFVYWL